MRALRAILLFAAAVAAADAPAIARAGGKVFSAPVPLAKPAVAAVAVPAITVFTPDQLAGGHLPLTSGVTMGEAALADARDDLSGDGAGARPSGALEVGFGNVRTRIDGELARRRDGLDLIAKDLTARDRGARRDGRASPNGRVRPVSGLANVWLDIAPSGRMVPYLGGGLGAARLSSDEAGAGASGPTDASEIVLAWQLGAGLAWDAAQRWALTLDYRWFNAAAGDSQVSPDGGTGSDGGTHSVLAGARLAF